MTIAFLAWYLGYIVTATYATSFVQRPVFGVITVGMVLGLAQFVTAGLITWAYVRFADNKLDPAAEAIRTMMENPKDASTPPFSQQRTQSKPATPFSTLPFLSSSSSPR